jgi:glutathione-regulated potassium-efflux system ancillary protein KefG
MDKGIKQVVILLAHPDIKSSQANKALMDAVKEMEEVAIYNLYEMRPEDAYNIDLWSKIISQASALVFQFPLYWMSAPSLFVPDTFFLHSAVCIVFIPFSP